MPIFYANELSDGRQSKRGISGRKSYVRTSPSNFFVLSLLSVYSAIFSMFKHSLHIYAMLLDHADTEAAYVSSLSAKRYVPTLKLADCLPWVIPNILVPFKRSEFPDTVREAVEQLPNRSIMTGTGAYIVYLFDSPSPQTLQALLSLIDGEFPEFESTKKYIHINHITPYYTLLARLTVISRAIALFAREQTSELGAIDTTWRQYEDKSAKPHELVLTEDGEGSVSLAAPSVTESSNTVGYSSSFVPMSLVLRPRADRSKQGFVGEVSSLPAISSHGHLVPFERNYAQPDRQAFARFLTTFQAFFTQEDMAEISSAWDESIHLTTVGDWMAHLMRSLTLCQSSNLGIYILSNSRKTYDGVVFFGTASVTHLSGVHKALSFTDLQADIANYRFHDSELARIVALMNIQTPVEEITSMRKLRSIIVPGTDLPDTRTMTSVSRIVSNLNFDQVPLSGSQPDWDIIIPLLTDPLAPIPDDLFLHHSVFFSTDRNVLVLSAFGETAPTFQLGTTRVRVSSVTAAETEKYKLSPYVVSGPKVLQTKQVSLETAASHWKSIMRTGVCALETGVHLDGGRVYSGDDKAHLWGHLNRLCIAAIARENTKSSVKPKGKGKRGMDDDESGSGSTAKKAKKMLF